MARYNVTLNDGKNDIKVPVTAETKESAVHLAQTEGTPGAKTTVVSVQRQG